MNTLSLLFMAVAGGIAVAQAIDAYPTLVPIERVATWWWACVCVLALVSLVTEQLLFREIAGVLISAFGLFIALNVRRIADHLARRKVGLPLFRKRTATAMQWRSSATLLVAFGAVWGFGG